MLLAEERKTNKIRRKLPSRRFRSRSHLVKDWFILIPRSIPSNIVIPICFISQTLSRAKTRYRPTELEIAALVWAIKRLKAHIRLLEGLLTVFTDHSATKQIVKKITLNITSTNRANQHLINASIYLLEYNLYVFYIPRKKNFIPNTLSRLKALETDKNIKRLRPNYTALNNIYIGIESLISQKTRDKFIQGYINDIKYLPILKIILRADNKPVNANQLNGKDAISALKCGMPFALKDRLLYYKQTDRYLRLYIPHAIIDKILKMAHDN
ncbi:unnamed protein product [Fusarium fujikuroi]|uniref:Reverse transcriptase RNase H-like domain-containing protein n=1 Tax=Fusarium fujikuroi TaxID=5127 RepID=A0A9Q9U9P3_FUSFU|nr:unnamed protein product [Fusarium fujikuroi]